MLLWAAYDPHRLPKIARELIDAAATDAIYSTASLWEIVIKHGPKDPFDRILIARAIVEGITLVTADAAVGAYPGPIRLV